MARPFFETHLPEPLLREGPRGLLWWQWAALPLAVFVSYVVGRFLGRLTRSLLRRVFARTKNTWDDLLLERLAAPITWMWAIGVAYLLFPWLAFRAASADLLDELCDRSDLMPAQCSSRLGASPPLDLQRAD